MASDASPPLPGPVRPGTVGYLMTAVRGAIAESTPVAEAIAALRVWLAEEPVTYLYALDPRGRLSGVVVLRDLFLAPDPAAPVRDIMLRQPFSLRPDQPLPEALRDTLTRHYPVYPVCTDDGLLIGLVRGDRLFQAQAATLQAQAGSAVGVGARERLDTPFLDSVVQRSSWLLVNFAGSLLTAGVILAFRGAIAADMLLAVLLPVIAAQGRNSGSQTMAVTLRSLNLGEAAGAARARTFVRESIVGAANGLVVGGCAAVLLYVSAVLDGHPEAWGLSVAVLLAMVAGSALAGTTGVAIPLLLRRLGRDPALSSSILLSNCATFTCQALFLGTAVLLT